jgi:hypothetical protein
MLLKASLEANEILQTSLLNKLLYELRINRTKTASPLIENDHKHRWSNCNLSKNPIALRRIRLHLESVHCSLFQCSSRLFLAPTASKSNPCQ